MLLRQSKSVSQVHDSWLSPMTSKFNGIYVSPKGTEQVQLHLSSLALCQPSVVQSDLPSTIFCTVPSGHRHEWLPGPERTQRAVGWHVSLLHGLGTEKDNRQYITPLTE